MLPKKDRASAGGSIRSADDLMSALRQDRKLDEGAGLLLAGEALRLDTVPTGVDTLDGVIGRGGLPRARMVVASGPEGGGKSSAALAAVASFQRRGGIGVYIDAERKLDLDWAAKNGVDLDKLLLSRPIHLERAFATVERAVSATDPSVPLLVVLDSVNAGLTKSQMDAGYEDQPSYGPQSRVLSTAIPKIMPSIERSGTTFLLISQIREKMNAGTTIAGGNSVKFYACLIVVFTPFGKVVKGGIKLAELRKQYAGGTIPDNELVITGADFAIRTIKNQIAPPFKESVMRIDFKRGVDRAWCSLRRGEEVGAVERSGAWYSFGGERLGQGVEAALRRLRKEPKVLAAIRKAIRKET